MSGELITGEVLTGSGLITTGLMANPSVFRSWLWGLVKSCGLRLLSYWYVPVIIIVVYCILLFGYNLLWSYLLRKLQKKCS